MFTARELHLPFLALYADNLNTFVLGKLSGLNVFFVSVLRLVVEA